MNSRCHINTSGTEVGLAVRAAVCGRADSTSLCRMPAICSSAAACCRAARSSR